MEFLDPKFFSDLCDLRVLREMILVALYKPISAIRMDHQGGGKEHLISPNEP